MLVFMHGRLPRLFALLRMSMLVLLMLGVVGRPLLNEIAKLHAIEHAALTAESHGHAHDDPTLPDPDSDPDPDHSQGGHALMHQADFSASSNLPPSIATRIAMPPSIAVPVLQLGEFPQRPAGSPFRPPIA